MGPQALQRDLGEAGTTDTGLLSQEAAWQRLRALGFEKLNSIQGFLRLLRVPVTWPQWAPVSSPEEWG